MKLKTLALLGAICTSVVFTSCKKDEDDKKEETPPPSIIGTWKITGYKASINMTGTDSIIDEFADWDACDKDDLERFNADKTYSYSAGAIKCDSNDVDQLGGTWGLSANNSKLTITITGNGFIDEDIFDVVTLNTTTLKLYATDGTFTLEMSYTRQ